MKPLLGLVLGALSLTAQDYSKFEVEKIAGDHKFVEGPAWSRDGSLLFSDIPANRIHRWTEGKPVEVYREDSGGANGNAFDAKGNLYTCEGGTRRVTRTSKGGKLEVVAERWEGKRLNSPNDLAVRRDGHVWFTDPAFGRGDEERELDFYGVYHITPKGQLELVAKPKGRPNGIALSPDGTVLYVANSDERNVRAYDVDRDGKAANERVVVTGLEGLPDGMKVDARGNLFITAKLVYIYSPAGKKLGEIPLGETPSNCAFGDEDLQSLYVTARTSVYRVRLNGKGSLQY